MDAPPPRGPIAYAKALAEERDRWAADARKAARGFPQTLDGAKHARWWIEKALVFESSADRWRRKALELQQHEETKGTGT